MTKPEATKSGMSLPLTAAETGGCPISFEGTCSLATLGVGCCGRVVLVEGETELRRRLLEMGLCGGAMIECVRRAPLGDPIEFRVRGYHLSLRGEQASLVQVRTGE
jgi:ferrous iron transport protein A